MFKKKRPPIGARPGTLVTRSELPEPRITVMRITPDHVEESTVPDVAALAELIDLRSLVWIDVQGLGDSAVLQEIADLLGLHALLIEDVVHTPQRPKTESYGNYQLLITRMIGIDEDLRLDVEQLSIVLGERIVVTFQEQYGDVLDPVRARIRKGTGARIRGSADYLAYAILDTVIDGYYPGVETIGSSLERLEDLVMESPTPAVLQRLHEVRNMLLHLRRSIWPHREAISSLVRGDCPLFGAETLIYLRDTHDHCVQMSEINETYRELVSGLMNTYLSVVSNRMNEVMKVLTIMASIFIPLTFLAGIYGMNFQNMPELQIPWFYPMLLCIMAVVSVGMVVFFYRRGWIGARSPNEISLKD